jgi:ribosomal protein L29
MVAKNIFEKLGLIEKVNEEESQESLLEEDDFFSDEEDSEDHVFEEKEDSVTLEGEEISNNDDQPSEVSDLEKRIAQMKEIDDELASKETMDKEQDFFDENDIEDKLDVLIGSYEKNKLLSIEDIYRNARLTLDTKKSIFMVDILSKTLPENLPIDVKRETVLSLMNVSDLKKDNLLNDAYQRIDTLNTVLEETVESSEEIIEINNKTIEELKKRIEELESINEERLEFQQDQNTLIEYEIQKIINLVDFVKPKK